MGFQSRTAFRSSVALDAMCAHECRVQGYGGAYWPAPTFVVVAADRPREPLIARSCTGCWAAVLRRIGAETEARRAAGEVLPPPPKTVIAGPEFFGFNRPTIADAIEALDPDRRCAEYWDGKEERRRAASGVPSGAPRGPRAPRPAGSAGRMLSTRERGTGSADDDSDPEAQYTGSRWSAVGRSARYRRRLEANGEDASGVDADNPLPDFMDPITLEPVVRPAISPYGHVMGAATWRVVLRENGACPFTKQPLRWEQCRMLTHDNLAVYRHRIVR
jgi:hypothetical protein